MKDLLILLAYLRLLYSSNKKEKPGPKGPPPEFIDAIAELKLRYPCFGCPEIAQQIAKTFGVNVDKDLVPRVLTKHYRPMHDDDGGPSWLSFFGHAKDSLWSIDLFRCESILLKSNWVLVIMDQFTRRIIGFGVHAGDVNGVVLCRMFNTAISSHGVPHYLSSGNDPIFRYHQWQTNLRILEIKEIKPIPYTPVSHPFVERLIRTIRREYLDHIFIWNVQDLERKLNSFMQYYNHNRVHQSLEGSLPSEPYCEHQSPGAELSNFS